MNNQSIDVENAIISIKALIEEDRDNEREIAELDKEIEELKRKDSEAMKEYNKLVKCEYYELYSVFL